MFLDCSRRWLCLAGLFSVGYLAGQREWSATPTFLSFRLRRFIKSWEGRIRRGVLVLEKRPEPFNNSSRLLRCGLIAAITRL
jgi:hypothetical protein